jgi:oxalate decarboxylase/phosphoglucose isomerase-like protein (cupin superfamily)
MTDNQSRRTTGPIIAMDKAFKDARGAIQPLVSGGFESAQLITCKKGAVRANHYHKADWHYCYMVYGSMRYYTRPTGSAEEPSWVLVTAGQTVYTPPMEDHAMEFLEDSAFVNFAGRPRDQGDYEDDLVRIQLIPAEGGFSSAVLDEDD